MINLHLAVQNLTTLIQILGIGVTPFTQSDILPMCIAAIFAAIAAVMVRILAKKHRVDRVTNYTRAEYFLVKKGKIKTEDLVAYHSSVNWANYAGFSFTALFVSISLIDFGGTTAELFSKDILAMAILLVSAIIMAMIDRVFTNNLSPLVTLNTRFRITYFCVHWGGFGFFLTIFALSIYFSKFNTWLAPLINFILMVTAFAAGRRRRISLDCIVKEHGLTRAEQRELEQVLSQKTPPWKNC